MPDTTVAYHGENGEPARPAINVKDHSSGIDYIMALDRLMPDASSDGSMDDSPVFRAAYDRIASDFWQQAEEIAEQRGLGAIEQQGRSGGWLVFTDGRDPQDMIDPDPDDEDGSAAERAEWLAAYRAMTEWADAWIADAPRKVAALAQQCAMNKAGEDAARRMFAFERYLTRGAHV